MPEEENAGGAGQQPKKPGPLGPTVLRPPVRAEPARGAAAHSPGHVQPTAIDVKDVPESPHGHSPGSVAPAVAQPAMGPTAIRGEERKRIPVTIDDLRALSPGADPDVLARALRLLDGYVEEDASDRTVVLWGHQLQQDYADLVSAALARSQADVLVRVTAHLNRMMEILASIDLGAVASTARGGGGLGNYFKRMSKKIDTPEELMAARTELDQLVKLMSGALDGLLALKVELEQSSHQIDQLGDDVEASALAAQFLSSYLQAKDEQLSRRFLERSMSLTQTALQIRGSGSLRENQIEQPLRFISAIQDVALVMVPGWLGSIASLTALAGRKPTPTEAGEMSFQLRKIIEQMNSQKG
jgi:hypothetical protein